MEDLFKEQKNQRKLKTERETSEEG
jgi:hypothetical protein